MSKPFRGVVDIVPFFKAGDTPPSGYNEWHEWAAVQHRAGLRQKRCNKCHHWLFPQEVRDHACE